MSSGRCWPSWPAPSSGRDRGVPRLSTRPVDQTLAAVPVDLAARERRRTHVMAPTGPGEVQPPRRSPCGDGALLPEALAPGGAHGAGPIDEQAVVPALRTGHLRGAAVGIVSVGELYPHLSDLRTRWPTASNTILCPRGTRTLAVLLGEVGEF
jgi:hypothetical protein